MGGGLFMGGGGAPQVGRTCNAGVTTVSHVFDLPKQVSPASRNGDARGCKGCGSSSCTITVRGPVGASSGWLISFHFTSRLPSWLGLDIRNFLLVLEHNLLLAYLILKLLETSRQF